MSCELQIDLDQLQSRCISARSQFGCELQIDLDQLQLLLLRLFPAISCELQIDLDQLQYNGGYIMQTQVVNCR